MNSILITVYSLLFISWRWRDFIKGKKTNYTLFYQLGRICQQGWQPDLSSYVYLYLEFQNSTLDEVRLVGKITLPSTTSMWDPSWILYFSGPNSPKKHDKESALFCKMEKVSPIHLQSLLPHHSRSCLLLIHENPTYLCLIKVICTK